MNKKKTHEQFIHELEQQFPKQFYSITKYTKMRDNIIVHCNKCNTDITIIAYHLLERGCSHCAELATAARIHQRNLQKFLASINNNISINPDEFKTLNDKINAHCNKCGHDWLVVANSLKRHGCPNCAKINMRVTKQQFLEKIQQLYNDNIRIISEFTNLQDSITYQCMHCNKKHIIKAISLYNVKRYLCNCNERKVRTFDNNRYQQFLKDIYNKYNNNIVILEYSGMHKLAKYKCNICGYEHKSKPADILKYGCKKCNHIKMLEQRSIVNKQKFLQIIEQIYNNTLVVDITTYKGAIYPIKCHCNKCGYDWDPIARSLQRTGCPNCSRHMSKGEVVIYEYLQHHNFVFEYDKNIVGCFDVDNLRFDFIIYYHNKIICIECDGEFHFKPIRLGHMTEQDAQRNFEILQRHDKIKEQFCKEQGIELIRIKCLFKKMSFIRRKELIIHELETELFNIIGDNYAKS